MKTNFASMAEAVAYCGAVAFLVLFVVVIPGCTESPSTDNVSKRSRFVIEEDQQTWHVLRDTKTGRLYYQGLSSSCAGFGEINTQPLPSEAK